METQGKRRRRRVKMSRLVRVRPSSPSEKQFEEVRRTVSVSPDGLYFTTWRDFYYKGMRVFVTYPYARPADPVGNDYVGEVVSIDTIGPHKHGVGVRFLEAVSARW